MKFRRSCSCIDLPAANQRKRSSTVHAFTLVELLVVIGIIALLISILLPALSAARRQAAAIKCAASLRDIGNAFQFYSIDNHGYAPPCKLTPGVGGALPYALDGYSYSVAGGTSPYWFNFLAKYETKTRVGFSMNNNANNATNARQSIFWACPAWTGYVANGTAGISGGINEVSGTEVTQTGYGMNGFPEFNPGYPPVNFELGEATNGAPYSTQVNTPAWAGGGWSNFTNKWYKLSVYQIHGSERALVGDTLFWFAEARPPWPPPHAMAGQYILLNNLTWGAEDGAHETSFDFYRHGVYPKIMSGTTDEFDIHGGKIAYNVLFCDGHVLTLNDQQSGYQCMRMKYPG